MVFLNGLIAPILGLGYYEPVLGANAIIFYNTSIFDEDYFKAMFGGTGLLIDSTAKYLLMTNLIIFIICIFE